MVKKKKLLLINPRNTRMKRVKYDPRTVPAPLSIAMVAALTHPHWEIELFDEHIHNFEMKEADLVGVTALTSQVNRAYEISEMYRREGIKTVIGGIHASMMPEEASRFVDVVVIGEAESVWEEVINDFEKNQLKKFYKGEYIPMHKSPIPRRDLLDPTYEYAIIQTSRGCPMGCEFCSVTSFNGRKYRVRPIKDVLDELEQIPQKKVDFLDDNLIGYSKRSEQRAIELFKGMIDRGIDKEWFCQVSINFGENEELLKYASEAGCQIALIGIEAEGVEQLMESKKKQNLKVGVKNYERIFDNIHKRGMTVTGTFMYGFDGDTPEAMDKRTDFIVNSNLDSVQATVYTPLPGTKLYHRIKEERRLLYKNFPEDWEKYHCLETAIIPKNMTPEQLTEEMYKNWARMYDKKTLYRKFLRSHRETRNIKAAIHALVANAERSNIIFGHYNGATIDLREMLGGIDILR